MSINFSHVLFLLLFFLIFKDGADRWSQSVSKGLPFSAAKYPRREQISLDFVMHALVWLHMIWFSDPVWCDAVRCFIHEFKMTS